MQPSEKHIERTIQMQRQLSFKYFIMGEIKCFQRLTNAILHMLVNVRFLIYFKGTSTMYVCLFGCEKHILNEKLV